MPCMPATEKSATYYVYELRDSATCRPFYVGRGKTGRAARGERKKGNKKYRRAAAPY